jgi:hypothetical protein
MHRHSNFGPPFFLIWSLPRLWYGSLSGSISLNHLSIFYNISCHNSLVLLTYHFWDEDKRRSFLKLARYCKISSRSEDSLFVFWRLFHTFMYRPGTYFDADRLYVRTTNMYWRNSSLFSTTHPTFLYSCRAHSGGQPNIFCFALFHWSERFRRRQAKVLFKTGALL